MDIQEINRNVIAKFRAGGLIEGMQRDRLVLLTTTGRRSGRRHTTPMMFHRDGDRVLVIASNVGAPKHPQWYLNLLANPRVTVEIGDEAYPAARHPDRRRRPRPRVDDVEADLPLLRRPREGHRTHDPGGGAHPRLTLRQVRTP